MNEFVYLKNGLFLELTSLGYAYQLVQKYSADSQIKVFEASPTPRGSLLILMSSSFAALKAIDASISTDRQNGSFIENSWMEQDLSEKLIEAYLNQILAPLQKNLVLIETESVCEALKAASLALKNGLEICEFRTLRSSVYKCCVSLTSSHARNEIDEIFAANKSQKNFYLHYFENPVPEIRNQYHLE